MGLAAIGFFGFAGIVFGRPEGIVWLLALPADVLVVIALAWALRRLTRWVVAGASSAETPEKRRKDEVA
jgi:hypothetical protein